MRKLKILLLLLTLACQTLSGAVLKVKVSGQEALPRLAEVGCSDIKPLLPPNPQFAAERARFGLDKWYVVTVADEALLPRLRNQAGVEQVVSPRPLKMQSPILSGIMPETRGEEDFEFSFDDPLLYQQWHLRRHPLGIQVADAWKFAWGLPDVVVAILDGGIDIYHEDLMDNLFVNRLELDGIPGYDDDGNGYIDDIHGFNFCTGNSTLDTDAHATHIAGLIGASCNNSTGVCGVAGGNSDIGSGVRLLSCQIFQDGDLKANPAQALVYAAENGAIVAHCSWTWDIPGYYEPDVLDAIRYFTALERNNKLAGGICIFPAGDLGQTGDFFPACMPEVISVAATDISMNPAGYSNSGRWVTLAAPGGDMDHGGAGLLSTLPDNSYGSMGGTSQAAAVVAGLTAAFVSRYGDPNMDPAYLKRQIATSVINFYDDTDYDSFMYGAGFLSSGEVIKMNSSTSPRPVSTLTTTPGVDNIALKWIVPTSQDSKVYSHIIYWSDTPFNAGSDLSLVDSVEVDSHFDISGTNKSYVIEGLDADTEYHIAVIAKDRWGRTSSLATIYKSKTLTDPDEQKVLKLSKKRFSHLGVAETDNFVDKLSLTNTETKDELIVNLRPELEEGENWLDLDYDGREIRLKAGEHFDLNIIYHPGSIKDTEIHKASLAVSCTQSETDDFELVIPILISRNSAPVLEVPNGTVTVKQGGETLIHLTARDNDDDKFSLQVSQRDNARFEATNVLVPQVNASVDEDGRSVEVDANAQTVYVAMKIAAPQDAQVGDSGLITLRAKDCNGNDSEHEISYKVVQANRAPQALNSEELELTFTEKTGSAPLNVSALFTDPDGDKLTYEAIISTSWLLKDYWNGNEVVFYGYAPGKTTVTLLATDPEGLSAKKRLTVQVDEDRSSVAVLEGSDGDFSVQMTNGLISVITPETGALRASVYALDGSLLQRLDVLAVAGENTEIDASNLPSGVYLLNLQTDSANRTFKFYR